MKILITGSGGREHAMVRKFLENPGVEKIYCAPGNGGTASEKNCENVSISDMTELADFAAEEGISLAVPGSEDMLVAGIADLFQERGIPVLGPHKKAALLEGSKCLAKTFMEKYGVKTAAYRNFDTMDKAAAYLEECSFPIVLKADGLAAGKGVLICANRKEAYEALDVLMAERRFGDAGNNIVIEEYLEGVEASILSFYDGKTILPLLSAKDHKKIGEGETGLNTGGMGVIAPNPHVDDKVMTAFVKDILEPTQRGLEAEELSFSGVIFFGLMINERGVFLLEYNLRMGDPETQAVLGLLDSDLLDAVQATVEGRLDTVELNWKTGSCCCVVLASGGYPEAYEKGKAITIDKACRADIFVAGAELSESVLKTSGGRVLNVVAQGADLEKARRNCYESIASVSFDKMTFRRDIGGPVLN